MLKDKFLETINKYSMITNEDNNILVAVSGGFDSTCLLYLLNELKEELNINIYIAHVNHCLRENAIIDEEYVVKLGKELNIPVFVKRIDINKMSKDEKLSTETAGRVARYNFFEQVAKENSCTKIATAHNANDNAETILANIFRGCGLNGLKGIRKIRGGKYIRPLIQITRAEIDKYLNEKNIVARLDESNLGTEYRRNKIRNELIPYIEKNFNQNIMTAINRMSDVITADDEYINNNVNILFNECANILENGDVVLDRNKMQKNEINIQKRLILKCIEMLYGYILQIEEVHINDILQMIDKNVGNKYMTPNKNLKVYINKGKIYFIKQ